MKPGGTTARGYGASHVRERKRWAVIVSRGQAICSRCHRTILPGTAWDLDHTDDRTGYSGPAHRYCNRRAGAAKRNRRAAILRTLTRPVTSRAW